MKRPSRGKGMVVSVPLVEAEPLVLVMHRVAVVLDLGAAEEGAVVEHPHVHHDLAGHIRNLHRPPRIFPDHLTIDVPRDLVGGPFEGIVMELVTVVERHGVVNALLDARAPLDRVVGRQHIRRHGPGVVPRDLEIDLAPMLVLRVPVHEHCGHVVAIDFGIVGLDGRRLHPGFIATIAEHVVPGAHLAARHLLRGDVRDLRRRAQLGVDGRLVAHLDTHLPVAEHDVILDEADLALDQSAVRPSPDRVCIEVDRL
eukprot:CAMPEP_0170397608 /NCGR_PEP_ID=MMETSP0117_2-20130122/22966_1 /TAXON_ID=400756 /ORGANISM="Durinskia baltica, Strain CSIRO CS-38" /LENGTH=254 /DNA_ID=CAMNT_0010654123 /DNA_START=171 /DNA_END=932 /DNA_ORIENTATION=-